MPAGALRASARTRLLDDGQEHQETGGADQADHEERWPHLIGVVPRAEVSEHRRLLRDLAKPREWPGRDPT